MSFDADVSDPHLAQAVELRKIFASDAVARDKQGGRPTEQLRLLKEAGLLSLKIDAEFGGKGGRWLSVMRIVRELARTDGSVAHLYGYHWLPVHRLATSSATALKQRLLSRSAAEQWFWGNSGNAMSKSLFGVRAGTHWVLNGYRPFSSGSHIADYLQIAWEERGSNERWMAAVPASRAGIQIENDWNGMGQTQTGSGTVTFTDVRVDLDEVSEASSRALSPVATLVTQLQQSVLLNVFVGSAQGALSDARDYTVGKSRPWIHSNYEKHTDDPWIKGHYGALYAQTKAATLFADEAARALDAVADRGEALTMDERGKAAVEIAAANVFATEVGLEVTSKVFEGMGARSATTEHGFDRFWRNVRTHTLHNPAEYKRRNVGDWFLTGEFPEPAIYQ